VPDALRILGLYGAATRISMSSNRAEVVSANTAANRLIAVGAMVDETCPAPRLGLAQSAQLNSILRAAAAAITEKS
jgi:hypothetical protein